MLLNLLDEKQLKHKYIYINIYTKINGTILKVHSSEINRYITKCQKIKYVFKNTSVKSGRRFLAEFTKNGLGTYVSSGITYSDTNNANSLDYLLWFNRRTVLAKILIAQICEEL